MKKFTTTFFLLMAMVLLLPTEVGAWGTLNLRSSIRDNWTGTNDDTFKQGTDNNHWTKEIDARNITGDISFRIYINTDNLQIYPKDGDGIELGNGMSTSDYNQNGDATTWSWKIPHSTTKFDKYIITANYINNNGWKWVISVTGKNIDAYVPTLDKKDEISCFVEVPSTINEVKIWAWNGSTKYTGNEYVDRPSLALKGYTKGGNKIFKWTYSGTETTAPSKVIFTNGDTKITADNGIPFTNHGYYVYDGKNNIEYSPNIDIITDVSGGETSTTPTPTPVTGKNLYLVGNFFDNETAINYNCRYFKLTDNGDNSYSIDIPATLSVNAQLLHVDGEKETVYGPNSNGYGISNTWPSGNNGSVPDQPLAEGTKNLTKYWTFADRGLASDGMYTLTVKLNDEGVPTKWSIKHDLLTRVAYFIANTKGATVHPAYSKRNNENASGDNKYFGSIYLPANTGCYVISNITKQSDSGNHDLRKTTKKFYLQGNSTGKSPATGDSKDTKVFPVQYNGSATIYKPFVFDATEGMQYLLEYNPTQGEDEIAKNYGYVGGEVQVQKYGTLADLVVKSMKIVGPAIKGDGWDLTANALDMTYNLSENCWEVTFDTTNSAGEYFRFVANNDWKSHWIENGTTDEDKAKIPYDGAGVGQPATVAVPNEVSYTTTERAESNKENDIIFNRNAGRWTVKFYIETESDQGGNYFQYKFRYTINGTPTEYVPVNLTYRVNKFIRSFSYGDNLDLPADGRVKAYEAYRFKQGDKATKKHGTVYLRRIEYIPANMGVILVGEVPEGSGTFKDGDVKAFNLTKRTAGLVDKNEDLWTLKDSYKNDKDWSEWNNYLVGTVTAVNDLGNAEVVDGKVTKRYFGLGHYHATNEYKKTHDGVDYIGFFRYTANAISGAHKAYLSIPTATDSKFGYIDFNGQWLDDNYDSSNDEISTLSKAGIIFDDIDFDETTAISNVNANEKNVKDGAYYTLQGIKVAKPTRGLYIHNGKKVIIK